MNWEEYRNFGHVEVDTRYNSIKIFKGQFSPYPILNPLAIDIVESANWQGNSLIIRGRNSHGEPRTFVQTGFDSGYLM